ncbi:SDR family NAD(P)-dependent oxidoreductase [Candidatus Peregrinibacteria bacterium]|nr:SDR family NAD(P)-dependent oxidoreductase [Candidatus Peregrinibacteria bacterium]
MVNPKLLKTFKGKKILVTGGTGSIGSEIVRQLLQFEPAQIRVYSRDESKHFFFQKELEKITHTCEVRNLIGDIRDKERLDKAMGGIDIVFHAAALKHVPFCEYNPFEAVKTNVNGTQNIIDSALQHNVEKVIAISSDKAVYPSSIMGITKLLMERMIINANYYLGESKTQFSAVRFGNVLHSRGSVIPLWIHQIQNGDPVTVTDKKMKRYFMSIADAVKLVFIATANMSGREIFVLKMKQRNIYNLAKEVIAKYNQGRKNVSIKITGAREREKISEKLFTKEEQSMMVEKKSYYVVYPEKE